MKRIKIPYGDADFESVRIGGYFYQDRTLYIEYLETFGSKYSVFLRPRRFGKSLFINMLKCYYGIEYKEKFDAIFNGLYIHENPTPLAHEYYIFQLDCSGVTTDSQAQIESSFLENVKVAIKRFLEAYEPYFGSKISREAILSQISAADMLKVFFTDVLPFLKDKKIYVLIDEYDHFTNELVTSNLEYFQKIVARNGFLRKFYEVLKIFAGYGVVGRMFITGVTPLTLDSLTSGFNITSAITLNPNFHNMMGFLESEVIDILEKIGIEKTQADFELLLADLREWYDGYRFCVEDMPHLYNTDMILFFAKEYLQKHIYPTNMLDNNIASGYQKIANIFRIGNNEEENFEHLKEFVEEGETTVLLTEQFNLELNFTLDDVWSMLFYMGMLTLKEAWGNLWALKMPNYVIKRLYFNYFTELSLREDLGKMMPSLRKAIQAMLLKGDIQPFMRVVEIALVKAHSNRDKIKYGEKHLKTLMIGLLFPFELYLIHSEYETESIYPDIFIERIPQVKINYEIVIELKYVKKENAEKIDTQTNKNLVDLAIEKGVQQLNDYMTTQRFNRPDIKGFCVVFVGNECSNIIPFEEY
jgi:hypothetical protein